jgi:lipoprotein-releasing system ATP-binding protein
MMSSAAVNMRPPPRKPEAAGLLRATNLHRILGAGDAAAHILKGVNLTIPSRSFVSIVGASGSGKSTLLYLLGGLDRPSQTDLNGDAFRPPSRVWIDGSDTTELNDGQLALLRNRKIGFVFQFHYLLKEFTAQENVMLPMLKLGDLTREKAAERAAKLLSQFNLQDKLRRKVNRLSGGEQQRVALARALANQPAVVLADEPTGNLDTRNGQIVADLLQNLAAGGQTIVMVTHDQSLAHRASRMITMADGNILKDENLRADA